MASDCVRGGFDLVQEIFLPQKGPPALAQWWSAHLCRDLTAMWMWHLGTLRAALWQTHTWRGRWAAGIGENMAWQLFPRSHHKGMMFRPGFHSPHPTDPSVNPTLPAGPRDTLKLFDKETQQGFRVAYEVSDLLAPSSGSPTQEKVIKTITYSISNPLPSPKGSEEPTNLQPESMASA